VGIRDFMGGSFFFFWLSRVVGWEIGWGVLRFRVRVCDLLVGWLGYIMFCLRGW